MIAFNEKLIFILALQPHRWEPSLTDHTKGYIVWPPIAPECMEITTTLYKDKRLETFEDKEWLFIIEEVRIHHNLFISICFPTPE